MAKLRVRGRSEREFSADICKVCLTVQETKKTSSKASISVSSQIEELLEKLLKIGIEPNEVELSSDSLQECSRYDSEEEQYKSVRSLSFSVPADVKIVNRIRDVVEDGFDNVSMNTEYLLSDEKKHQKEVLMQAVQDSRLMAEAIAEADGKHIKGIKAADLNGDDWEDLYEANEPSKIVRYKKAESLSDRLKPEKIMLSAEVNVVWICG